MPGTLGLKQYLCVCMRLSLSLLQLNDNWMSCKTRYLLVRLYHAEWLCKTIYIYVSVRGLALCQQFKGAYCSHKTCAMYRCVHSTSFWLQFSCFMAFLWDTHTHINKQKHTFHIQEIGKRAFVIAIVRVTQVIFGESSELYIYNTIHWYVLVCRRGIFSEWGVVRLSLNVPSINGVLKM